MSNIENYQTSSLNNISVDNTGFNLLAKNSPENFNGLFNKFLKRLLDIIFSFLIIIFLSPLIIVISILIKLTSKGNIFYTQERITRNEKKFLIYKFRSMKSNAELKTGPVFAQDNDERCTKIGHVLRKISFDELPQFFNVLKGDMSLVGPRPERPYYVDKFKKEIDSYSARHTVKSGMTGLAQINGLRGNSSIEERLKYDLIYINNYNILFDVKIIYLTVLLILKDIFLFLMEK